MRRTAMQTTSAPLVKRRPYNHRRRLATEMDVMGMTPCGDHLKTGAGSIPSVSPRRTSSLSQHPILNGLQWYQYYGIISTDISLCFKYQDGPTGAPSITYSRQRYVGNRYAA